MLTEPHRRLCGHTAKITGMAWSPHHEARLVTASYDGTAQVWDVLQEAPLCNYQGHAGNLLCVDWSPVDPDVIWTGGKDFTVHEWRISKQEFTKPPKGEAPQANPTLQAAAAAAAPPRHRRLILSGKKSVKLKEKSKMMRKQKKASGAAGAAQLEMNGESTPERQAGAEAEASEEEEREELGSSTSSAPPGNRKPNRWCFKRAWSRRGGVRTHRWAVVPAPVESQVKVPPVAKSRDKHGSAPDVLKKKKPRSLLPVSTSMDHRPREELLQDCVALASVTHGNGEGLKRSLSRQTGETRIKRIKEREPQSKNESS